MNHNLTILKIQYSNALVIEILCSVYSVCVYIISFPWLDKSDGN